MNQMMVAGNLGADPEVRFTSSGQKVTSLRLAAKARKGKTIWWKVSVWGEQFDKMIVHLKKGSSLIVFGELNEPEIYTDRDGKPQVSMSITATNLQFSPFGRSDGAATTQQTSHAANNDVELAYAAQTESSSGQSKSELAFSDDDMPF